MCRRSTFSQKLINLTRGFPQFHNNINILQLKGFKFPPMLTDKKVTFLPLWLILLEKIVIIFIFIISQIS